MPMPTGVSCPPGPSQLPPDMTRPELVFLHIPKAAGTSQQNAFALHYGSENIFWIGKDCRPNIWHYPRAQVGERYVVGGHKRLSFYPRGLDSLYCAILRDPVERAVSLFAYYTRPDLAISGRDRAARTDLLAKMLAKGIDPDSMLNSIRDCRPFRREISNYQCRYLSRGRATLAAVQDSLRSHDYAIGTVASYERFHRELWDLLDWAEEPPVRVNRGRDDYAADYLGDEALVARIAELNREDQKLVQWVEAEHRGLWLQLRDARQRRRQLRRLPLQPGRRRARQWRWEDAPELWPQRAPQSLMWPLSRMMVAEPCRLLYMPIPGAADAAIQRVMLELSRIPHREALLALGIDGVVEQFCTGLMLADRSAAEIQAIGASTAYFRFAIVYEPVARLVDIYQQRFVELREMLPRWPGLYQLALAAQRCAAPDAGSGPESDIDNDTDPHHPLDLDLGITFRQFVGAVVSGKYDHPLWRRQVDYLAWANTYSRLYRPDQLAELVADLSGIAGCEIRLGVTGNNAPVPRARAANPAAACYADTPPGQLPPDPEQWREQLVDDALVAAIKNYYAWDFKLYNRTADKTGEGVQG